MDRNEEGDSHRSQHVNVNNLMCHPHEDPDKLELSRRETSLVFRSRLVFFFLLAVIALIMGVLTFEFSQEVEDKDFETRFNDFARQVIDVSQINAMSIYQRYQTMASQLTAVGLHDTTTSNRGWPYVQLPCFEAQASAAQAATAAVYVVVTPVVQRNELEQYETFVATHQAWIQDALEHHGANDTNASALPLAPRVYPLHNQSFEHDMILPFHLPVSQISSVHMTYTQLNADVGTDYDMDVAFAVLNRTRKAVMSGLRLSTNPSSFLATPVFASFADDAPIVAIFSGYLRWYRNFENLLPRHSEPLILVIRNCDDALSYLVRGPDVEFLGYGETFHDPKYNYLERNGTFTPYTSSTGCDFTLHIFPTPEFETAYRTNSPTTKTIAIVSCFIFTAVLFVLFNIVVEYRQKRLVSNATTNSALVSSLFPATVRERLAEEYTAAAGDWKQQNDNNFLAQAPLTRRPPIADRFDSCSVFFADLVGFTSWSSTREPEKVLILLETIFNAFDQIAKRMGVYKVETIGDCYMAATGVPEKRNDHAILLVKFAEACLVRLSELLPCLQDSLGESTVHLAMRIGIHSGPVTAGVLRGDRSRYQLFGDTVNTASRMESNGQPGRIHVSATTAQHIVQLGKSRWLTPRADPVVAKGKGTMETFWINVEETTTASSSSMSSGMAKAEQQSAAAMGCSDNVESSSEVLDGTAPTLAYL